MKPTILSLAILAVLFSACQNKAEEKQMEAPVASTASEIGRFRHYTHIREVPKETSFVPQEDSIKLTQIADLLLEDILSGKLQANLPSDSAGAKVLSVDEIKSLLAVQGKETISALSFTEDWLYEAKAGSMVKKIGSVRFCKRFLNAEGEYLGLQPLFQVNFNN